MQACGDGLHPTHQIKLFARMRHMVKAASNGMRQVKSGESRFRIQLLFMQGMRATEMTSNQEIIPYTFFSESLIGIMLRNNRFREKT